MFVSNASDVDKSNAKDSVLTNCPDSGSLNPESNIFDAEMQGSITRDYGLGNKQDTGHKQCQIPTGQN